MSEAPILLVEDNDDDADLTAMAFREAKISNPLVRARDGVEALALLHGESGVVPTLLPVVVLLDLKLPKISGIEVLRNCSRGGSVSAGRSRCQR